MSHPSLPVFFPLFGIAHLYVSQVADGFGFMYHRIVMKLRLLALILPFFFWAFDPLLMLTVETGLSHTLTGSFLRIWYYYEICHSVRRSVSFSCLEMTFQKAVPPILHVQTHIRMSVLRYSPKLLYISHTWTYLYKHMFISCWILQMHVLRWFEYDQIRNLI